MAEKVPIICPDCAKQFQVPEEILGRKIRCKNCGKAFVAKKAENVVPSQNKPEASTIPFMDDDDDGDGKPYEVTSIDLSPRCPSCANELQSETDKVCLHCGFNLETRTAAQKRRIKDVTGGDIFVHLLPGILAAVGFFICLTLMILEISLRLTMLLFIWIFYSQPPDFDKMEQIEVNLFNCFTLWTCLAMIFLMYFQGKFAVKRLIYETMPPEVEL